MGGLYAHFASKEEPAEEAFQTGGDPTSPQAPQDPAPGSLALMVGGMILARATTDGGIRRVAGYPSTGGGSRS